MKQESFILDILQLENLAMNLSGDLVAGDVICLRGDLGSGKTTFSQFLIHALTASNEPVTSPTFNLVHNYKSPKGMIWHFDLYRLEDKEEIYNIGIDDAFDSGISIIEWPEIIEDYLPKNIINIHLKFTEDDSKREVFINR